MSVICRENSSVSFGRLNPDGSLVRMFQGYVQASLDGSLENSSMTFPRWGILSGGVAGELLMSGRVTGGNGFLLLPTVTTQEIEHPEMKQSETGRRICGKDGNTHSIELADRIAMLPTLNTCDATMGQLKGKEFVGTKHAMKLEQAINLLQTPTSRDHKDIGKNTNYQKISKKSKLAGRISLLPTVTTPRPHDNEKTCGQYIPSQNQKDLTYALGKNHGLKLQPAFAEWMMGFPIGWTDLPALGMPSSHNKCTRSLKQSRR
jgi:hypothetical protein